MTASRDAERDAIKAAMDRLLNGAPAASTGALSVLQLAAEAGVKRWVLTHKHPDLKAEFERRRTASNGIPAAFQNLQARIADLEVRATAAAFCFHQAAIFGGFVPLVLTFIAGHYQVGFAIPMMVGTCVGALSFACALIFSPETKGKVLVPDLVVA